MAIESLEPDNGRRPFATADSGDVEELDDVVGEDAVLRTLASNRFEVTTPGS